MKLGSKHTEESKRKIINSAPRGKNHPNWGKKFSLEYRRKLSEAHLGKRPSLKTRRKMSEALQGNQRARGKKHSLETRKKISKAGRGIHSGEKHWNWKGGKSRTGGYVIILKPNSVYNYVYVYEHRLVMEEHLGRALELGEVIHHKNRVRDDNRIENLMLFSSQAEHMTYHKENKGVS